MEPGVPRTNRFRQFLRDRTPERFHPFLRRTAMNPYANRVLRHPRWGNLRRDRPFSGRFGRDRGTPIDQYYVEQFIAANQWRISGHVLAVGDDTHAMRYGRGVDRVEVIDIVHSNLAATLLADLAEMGSLEEATYDCAIITQTLHYIPDAAAALKNVWRSLKPGGHLLLSVPGVARRDSDFASSEAWRFLEPGLRHLVEFSCTPAPVGAELRSYGNLRASIATLLGLAAQELTGDELSATDNDYPVVVTLVATKLPG